jgi:hypothetical protein
MDYGNYEQQNKSKNPDKMKTKGGRKFKQKNKQSIRTRKRGNKNKRLKKYGGTQPYTYVTFFGEKNYQPECKYNESTTIGELVASKNGHLYHRGRLISSYPNGQLVRKALTSDDDILWKYNINQIMSKEPPPERIPVVPVTVYEYDSDPND